MYKFLLINPINHSMLYYWILFNNYGLSAKIYCHYHLYAIKQELHYLAIDF